MPGRDYDEEDDILDLDGDDEGGFVDPGAGERRDAAEADDADDAEDGDGTPEERETRRDKKRKRGQLFNALLETQKQNRELLSQLAQQRHPVQQPVQQQPSGQLDPYQVEIARTIEDDRRIRAAAKAEYAAALAAGKQMPEEKAAEYENQIAMNEVRRQQLVSERTTRMLLSQHNPTEIAHREAIHAQYNDVRQNPTAIKWATAVYEQRVIERGEKADGPELLAEVMNDARTRFKIGNPSRRGPSEGDRRRFVSAGGGALAGGGSRRASHSGELNATERKLAESMYDKFPPAKAHAMWKKNVLSKVAEE